MYRDELLDLVSNWTPEQLNAYIQKLETRITDAHVLVKDLKQLRKRKTKRKVLDNGPRDGR
jgi:hypothetical protein